MTYKKNKNQATKKIQKKKTLANKDKFKKIVKNKNFIWSVILVIVIVVIVIVAITHPFFLAPSNIKAGEFVKVSDSDVAPDGHIAIYYLSWYGCPIGATDSWAFYMTMNSTTNIYSHVILHHSSSSDIYPNQPGLLFNGSFTFSYDKNTVYFYPLYMYNQTMTGTIDNKSITGTLASYGLSLINTTYPSAVAKLFNKYASDITYKGHLETSFIITGPHGTYMGYQLLYNPGEPLGSVTDNNWSSNPPSYVIDHLSSSSGIISASSTINSTIDKVA